MGADLANLILYCVQQLGITLGVGAEAIMLAAYIISMRDGVVDEKETQYAYAIKSAMTKALWLIVISGLGITALHLMTGQGSTIATPAYLFKCLLIALVVTLALARRVLPQSSMVEGAIGATWFALFLVHILAPVTSWFNLFTLYGIWLAGFVMCWEVVVLWSKDKTPGIKKMFIPSISQPPTQEMPPPPPASPAPMPTIVLGPDIHTQPLPPAPPAPQPIRPMFVPAPQNVVPSPAGIVTDTPFLPRVAPLQPIPAAPNIPVPVPPLTPNAHAQSPATPPVTTLPGGTSTPVPTALVQEGLSAMNIMPKAPPAQK